MIGSKVRITWSMHQNSVWYIVLLAPTLQSVQISDSIPVSVQAPIVEAYVHQRYSHNAGATKFIFYKTIATSNYNLN